MGSVTYRVLCLTRTLVLALPASPAREREKVRSAGKNTPGPRGASSRQVAKRSAKR